MHSVRRSPEPAFFAELRAAHTQWDDLDRADRRCIRDALLRDFGPVCAYCQQPCQSPNRYGESSNDANIDHFRPRNHFPDLWLDWLNLIYACRRCNQSKGDSWPSHDDAPLINQFLTAEDSRYTPVSEYVNPNAGDGRRPAHEFFDWDFDTGEIKPAEQLDNVEWSIARRTIQDIDLNDSGRGEYDPGHLWLLRRNQLNLLIQRLKSLEDSDLQTRIMREFTLPDKPFSGFISAYLAGDY